MVGLFFYKKGTQIRKEYLHLGYRVDDEEER